MLFRPISRNRPRNHTIRERPAAFTSVHQRSPMFLVAFSFVERDDYTNVLYEIQNTLYFVKKIRSALTTNLYLNIYRHLEQYINIYAIRLSIIDLVS